MPELREVVIVATVRTPMGRYGGQLKDVRARRPRRHRAEGSM